jgi:hypothetical protein
MKRYLILFSAFVLIGMYSCQTKQSSKQYFEASPEIDVVNKVTEAFLNQDWETYRTYYSDTAKIWENTWYLTDQYMSIDKSIEGMRALTSSFIYQSFEETTLEMIITNKGEKWVYFWGNWTGKFTDDGEEIVIPIHHAMLFVDGKIVSELNFFDSHPIYLAQMALEKEDK